MNDKELDEIKSALLLSGFDSRNLGFPRFDYGQVDPRYPYILLQTDVVPYSQTGKSGARARSDGE